MDLRNRCLKLSGASYNDFCYIPLLRGIGLSGFGLIQDPPRASIGLFEASKP